MNRHGFFSGDNFKSAVVAAGVAMALLALDGRLGPESLATRRGVGLAVAAALALGVASTAGRSWAWLAAVPAIWFTARAPSAAAAACAFVAALAAIAVAARGSARVVPRGLAEACLSYVALRFLGDLVPQVRDATELLALAASRYIGVVQGVEARLSITALGGAPVLMAALLSLWSWRARGGFGRLAGAVVAPCGWLAALPAVTPDAAAGPIAPFLAGAAHGAFWIAAAAAANEFLPDGRGLVAPREGRPRLLAVGLACLAAAVAGFGLTGTAVVPARSHKSIVVHNRGGLDWDRPVFGRFGAFSGGMFGLLPVSCRADGYEFSIIDRDAVVDSDLQNAQILVLINTPKIWEGAERAAVLGFVNRGGSLLVLGDHTDVFGLMGGFNSLLEPLGVRFRFDSAYKAREGWRGCQAAAPDLVARGWDDENPSVAVGAGLDLKGWARPLLVGRYAFSDGGVRDNVMGSFLGNYHLDRGERVGDVVLAATTTVGSGRVVVWGDTSAFQGGLSSTQVRVVGPMLDWMSRPAAWSERPLGRILAASALVFAIAVVAIGFREIPTLMIALSLFAGLTAPALGRAAKAGPGATVDRDVVLIDHAHFPNTGHYEARINPIGPLYTNLLRSGFRVVDMDDWRADDVAKAGGIAFVAPVKPFEEDEVQALLGGESAGLVVILAAGEPDAAASRRLLAAHGLAIEPRPLGAAAALDLSISRVEREKHPRFLDAWPIVTDRGGDPAALSGVDVLERSGRDVVALFRKHGEGGLLLIADSRFFSDMNIEDVSSHHPGNLAFIHDQFERYLHAHPDAVAPLFRSPEKPR